MNSWFEPSHWTQVPVFALLMSIHIWLDNWRHWWNDDGDPVIYRTIPGLLACLLSTIAVVPVVIIAGVAAILLVPVMLMRKGTSGLANRSGSGTG